ncbi:MAG: O-antigen ligase family protein [Flavobacteriales bacterium]|nr:O-antigen ligase family protein [Flavobacteriales bacterium]
MLSQKNILKPENILYLGLILVAIGLPLSKFLMSVGQMIIFLSWILLGNYKQLLINYFNNTTAVAVSLLFLLHLVGLLYTSDFKYAINDIRVKMPLFLLPFVLSSFRPLTKNQFKWIFYILSLSVILSTLIGLTRYLGLFGYEIIDKREISVFISHIRFGLIMVVTIIALIYFYKTENRIFKIFIAIAIFWMCFFMLSMGFITGLSVLFIFLGIYLLKKIFTKYKTPQWKTLLILFLLLAIPFGFMYITITDYHKINMPKHTTLLTRTKGGEAYYQDLTGHHKNAIENGYLIYRNIAWKELEESWNNRSQIKYNELDLSNQQIKNTLLRFLTSKGLNKDAEGVASLSNGEIKAIENGMANVNYMHQSAIKTRLHQIVWEIDNYLHSRDYNGHSIVMRWIYWKTGFKIVKENFLLGVGTGDVQNEFQKMYEKENSILKPEFRLRAHNQFITFAITFGVFGILVFIAALFYPLYKLKLYNRFIYLGFFVVVVASFITEDTLESQAGVTFYIFMHSILCWLYPAELDDDF